MPVVIRYAHQRPSHRPLPLSGLVIERLAQELRAQLCRVPHRPKVDLDFVVRRAREMEVNGIALELRFDIGGELHDGSCAALGMTSHDGSPANLVRISLNGPLVGDDEAIARSTTLHELGHVVFDAPSWIVAASTTSLPIVRCHHLRAAALAQPEPMRWHEWRANAFMGAFLCPRPLLHQWLVKRGAALGLTMIENPNPADLPIVRQRREDAPQIDALLLELAEIFGVSVRFIEMRLHRYGLIWSH